MSEKQEFLKVWEREFTTTLKVLKAFPGAQADLKPHERCRSAKELAWTFVLELRGIDNALKGNMDPSIFRVPPPAKYDEAVTTYEKEHRDITARIKKTPDGDLDQTIKFPTGPGKMGEVRKLDFFWFILMDCVHHRGQFSVYLRMAGGKVPSIYGPSADEKWS